MITFNLIYWVYHIPYKQIKLICWQFVCKSYFPLEEFIAMIHSCYVTEYSAEVILLYKDSRKG